MQKLLLCMAMLACTSATALFAGDLDNDNGSSSIRIADLVQTDIELSFSSLQRSMPITEAVISAPGASFVKVHFDYFNLPEGAYIEVSDPKGREVYRYGSDERDSFTYDEALGEDGYRAFASMSITGDTAIVRLKMGNKKAWSSRRGHGVFITQYMEGYPEDVIEELLGESLIRSTCGVNERKDVKCYESSHPTEYNRARSVARLVMSGSLCTAWRVGDGNHVFTNNHCMSTASAVAASESWFNYQNTSCNGSTLDTIVKVSGNTMYATDFTLDYTLYSVNNFNSISGFGNLGLDVRSPSQDEEIYIPQHGSGNPKELAITSDQNAGNICRIDVVSATGNASGTDTGYYCDTIGGSSGSPVLARSSHRVIALHHFGGCANQGVRMDKIWPQVSSFFGGQIPSGSGGTPTNQAPTANFTSSISGLSVNFSDTSSDVDGNVVSWAWTFGDGGTSSVQNPSHAYASAGNYNVTLTVTDDDGATNSRTTTLTVGTTGGDPYLANGQVVSGLSGTTGNWVYYRIAVPSGATNLAVNISGGSGDADLYLRFGGRPTTSTYDCRPYIGGNTENCNVASPQTGDYYIGIRAYSNFSGLNLTASYTEPGSSTGYTKTGLAATTGNWQHFTIDVPAGASRLAVETTCNNGDADVYVKFGSQPTTSSYDCRPYTSSSSETCNFDNPQQGTWYISVRAYSSFTDLTLDVYYFD